MRASRRSTNSWSAIESLSSQLRSALPFSGLPLLYFLHFDFNPLNLRSSSVELISTYLELRKDPNTGASSINVLANSRKDAQAIAQKMAKLPEVSRVMTIESFVPEDQQAKLAMIREAAPELLEVFDIKPSPPPSPQEAGAALTQAANSLDAAGAAPGPGGVASKRLAAHFRKLAASSDQKRDAAERVFIVPLVRKIAEMKKLLQARPVTVGQPARRH